MIRRVILLATLSLGFAGAAFAQCAPGIPSAGNPGCIPPTAPNSPYNQGTGAAPPPGPEPVWRETWGAVAIDMGVGRAGMSDTEKSKDSAIAVALDRCKSAGGTQCEIKTTYHNQCVALAQEKGGGDVVTVTGPDQTRAESRSVEKCGGEARCAVVYSACSDAVRVQ
ncbi:DUF4189 domain-containing protein [Luteibacter aegosomatis]|uniref:DUF4189 domain-containing protein n=1 Tax=Luteibacter aegosomatis TaxID=2911537 RepID=UPI001FFA5811|nr:DUF4189 domain-containing protein [Luteibacter aegosomatis]UPG84675.1 DUF4189 domain-containing protein [Luteibacter aegosomatis]